MSGSEIIRTEITYFGQKAIVACDGKCDKAFGMNQRLTSPNSLDEDDFEWLGDDELGDAPTESPITEGFEHQNKPSNLTEAHNKWCVRECERSVLVEPGEVIVLPDFSRRQQNISTNTLEFTEPVPDEIKSLLFSPEAEA
jgi:hypothetical protein